MIPTLPFGRTGHESTRVIFGAAGLWTAKPDRAQAVLETLLEFGVNHIDTAASYGDSELRLAPWLREHRHRFFLATKTGERGGEQALQSLHRSLERMGTDRVDMIQLHNLVDEAGWEQAFAPGGAVEALAEARDQGLTRFIGVTGHGTRVAAMHRRSLERFPFDSVLLPCNYTMLQIPGYAADYRALLELCRERGVAVQTIKSVARRRWTDEPSPRFSWYEPLLDDDAVARAVRFVLAQPDVFLNTSSDLRLLRRVLEVAREPLEAPPPETLEADVARFAMQPLFVPGVQETI